MTDEEYMSLALKLAQKGEGRVDPNPLMGAVAVKDGVVISRGYHHEYGGPHAEREALASLTRAVRGVTPYIALEPCCHYGETPPCTDAIMESGISHVVIGTTGPDPLVVREGVFLLDNHGIQVIQGVLEAGRISQSQVLFHSIRTKQPYVVMKYAMTMDGRTTTCTRRSRWIAGDEARMRTHKDRNHYNAIMADVGTILKDGPLLTRRLPGGGDPVWIIYDTRLRTPATSRIVSTARSVRTILATCRTEEDIIRPYRGTGYGILTLPQANEHMGLVTLMKQLGEMNIDSILLEEGAALDWSALGQDPVHKIQAYMAPKLFGRKDAPSPVDGKDVGAPGQVSFLKQPRITVLGGNILLENEVSACLQA